MEVDGTYGELEHKTCTLYDVPVISVNNAPAHISSLYFTELFEPSMCCIIQPNVLICEVKLILNNKLIM